MKAVLGVGSDIVGSIRDESSRRVVVFELLILFFTPIVGWPCSVGIG